MFEEKEFNSWYDLKQFTLFEMFLLRIHTRHSRRRHDDKAIFLAKCKKQVTDCFALRS